jgi:hypothetical protein
MFKLLMSKNYLVIVLLLVVTFILLQLNPVALQNKRYKLLGDSCPNPLWYTVILWLVGTTMYIGAHYLF